MNTDPIVVDQAFDVPPDVVWEAITDKDQMCKWFFENIPDFKPEVGFATEFTVRCDEQDYRHLWQVTEVIPEKRIAYSWRYGGYPGNSTVTWELSATPAGTKLSLAHAGGESFPQDVSVFSRESCQGGWDYFIRERLQAFLARTA